MMYDMNSYPTTVTKMDNDKDIFKPSGTKMKKYRKPSNSNFQRPKKRK